MLQFKRDINNPLISPNPNNDWEAAAAFNGSITQKGDSYDLLYRALSNHKDVQGKHIQLSVIGHTKSQDGIHFEDRHPLLSPQEPWEQYGCEDPLLVEI